VGPTKYRYKKDNFKTTRAFKVANYSEDAWDLNKNSIKYLKPFAVNVVYFIKEI